MSVNPLYLDRTDVPRQAGLSPEAILVRDTLLEAGLGMAAAAGQIVGRPRDGRACFVTVRDDRPVSRDEDVDVQLGQPPQRLLEDGRIVDRGTHAQLLKSSETYQEIVSTQLRAEDAA